MFGTSESPEAPPTFAEGMVVEYFSGTLNAWIPAKIVQFNKERVSFNVVIMLCIVHYILQV